MQHTKPSKRWRVRTGLNIEVCSPCVRVLCNSQGLFMTAIACHRAIMLLHAIWWFRACLTLVNSNHVCFVRTPPFAMGDVFPPLTSPCLLRTSGSLPNVLFSHAHLCDGLVSPPPIEGYFVSPARVHDQTLRVNLPFKQHQYFKLLRSNAHSTAILLNCSVL